jgi:predicted CxxxxCH...CXXCH cytochrome family protein
MSQIVKRSLAAIILASGLLAFLSGCGNTRNDIFDPETGKHKAGWLPEQHMLAATSGTTSLGAPVPSTDNCIACHGTDLLGGIAQVSCTDCHMGGPTAVHPMTWDPVYLTHGPTASSDGTAACSNLYCHGPSLGGVASSGPACTTCHSWPFDPATITCGSCHRVPPDGGKHPNIAGKHGKHATSSTASCDTCHTGASSYLGNHHNNTVDISFLAAYAALTRSAGTPTYSPATGACAGISCHGGQTTPSWLTGSLNVNTQCASCHASGTSQYNSYSSGEHNKHVNDKGFSCTECHDAAKLSAVHFNDLGTTVMDEAALTILDTLNYTGTAGSPATGSCTVRCHGKNHTNESW